MKIGGYQKLTLLDYPGKTACTIFTAGCNMRCPFCHNAGLVLTPNSESFDEDEIFDYLSKRSGILDGVCITGGEPLLQHDLKDFIKKVKSFGYKVKLDTNGTDPKKLESLVSQGLIDYIAMDIKSSAENYEKATGVAVDLERIKHSIHIIKQSGLPHEFRTTAVKGIHTLEDFSRIHELIGSDSPYFIQSFVDSGNLISKGEAFSHEETVEIYETVKKTIPQVLIRGTEIKKQ